MAYVVPIHRASSIRHALKLQFFKPEEDSLVVAKASRLEFYSLTPDGLNLTASRALYAKVTMLARLPAPANSPTDHLFVGTDQNTYFTLSWDSSTSQVRTERSYVDLADKSSRESQTGDRCLIDPSGRFMTLEIFEGIITVIPIVQPSKKKGKLAAANNANNLDEPPLQVGELGEPVMARIDELVVRSSAFLHVESRAPPRLALLYEDNQRKVRLKVRELQYSPATSSSSAEASFAEGEVFAQDLDLGASHLIPVPAPLDHSDTGGLLILGETSIKYIDDASNETISQPLEEATVFVAWEQVDGQRWLLADDYGRLFFLMLLLDSNNEVESWKLDYLGDTSRASVLVYLGAGVTFIGSHQGDSQVIRIGDGSFEVIQTLSNIAPILDFTIMDLGTREGENYTHEFSSGQARIVTGSGAFNDGTLRSVRSGVGMEELGVLGEMDHITDLWALQVSSQGDFADTLLVTFVDETRVFRFDPEGEVEELDEFLGLSLSESTLHACNLPNGRILQVTESGVSIADTESGMVTSHWSPPNKQLITSASSNDDSLVLVTGGQVLLILDVRDDLKVTAQKNFGVDNQISGVTIPESPTQVCIVAFPQSARVSVLSLADLEELHTRSLGPTGEAFPRSVLLADILANSPPTLFISMADGSVVTFSYNVKDHFLTGTSKLILGSEQPFFKKLPRGDGLFNVFATCEHPSLIYGSEGRIIYSAVNSEGASRICHFNTEAYPGSIAVATPRELKIALVDKERTTQIQTLPIGATVRRVAYSPAEKAFGIGTIKRTLQDGAEIVESQFVLADEIMFRRLDAYDLRKDELVESVIRAEIRTGQDERGEPIYRDRFIVGTAYLDDEGEESIRGRILMFEVDSNRKLGLVTEHPVKGACRALAMMGEKIVAALVKTVVIFNIETQSFGKVKLNKAATYRTSTAPVDIAVTDNIIAVADLMKSISIVESSQGDRFTEQTKEVARHFSTVWTTAVADIGENMWLVSDAEGNLIVLRRNVNGVTDDDRRRLEVTSEMLLGEMVNRIRPVNIPQTSSVAVTPRAFLGTVEGSIYLFALINPEHQDFLMRLQTAIAAYVDSPGKMPFNKFRAFRSAVREAEEPFRFVDGELIEQFLVVIDVSDLV
ncbi:UV-damaged DNA binding protein [Rasamsonia emersonii CBS 393.64]|uniref:DNA damage-binding protein 1 n=1 Tax=Rasamsonia emersonii (strain ATCC 16479 / CBS 393.64 / IMI 116815) TaxID=1408163 RepID=A0A0F4Z6I7_RASE3|nr:UV-damaged DNA binding protein [Rasamsonia emersonii CBS 393.64]KKA25955.1 UV-damaged DNA binding protein [Rasamsonia emersonii CBS 393.64]